VVEEDKIAEIGKKEWVFDEQDECVYEKMFWRMGQKKKVGFYFWWKG